MYRDNDGDREAYVSPPRPFVKGGQLSWKLVWGRIGDFGFKGDTKKGGPKIKRGVEPLSKLTHFCN